MPLAQPTPPQTVTSAGGKTQASRFTPSQRAPHEVPAPAPPHAGLLPRGVPVTTLHVPAVAPPVVTSHASQAPVHAALQHTPSAQWPLVHCPSAPQAAPSAFFGTHALAEHHALAVQSASFAQLATHAPAAQLA
jgi:hypothetical protein